MQDDWPVSRAASPVNAPAAGPSFGSMNIGHSGLVRSAFSGSATPGTHAGIFNSQLFGGGGQEASLATSHLLSDSFQPSTTQEEATAADLLADFNLDFGFTQGEPSAALDGYSNLLDDTTMSFWASMATSNGADWFSSNNPM